MRKVLIPLLILLLLFSSCATYTIAEAREAISYPEGGSTETRIRVINEKKEAEEEAKRRALSEAALNEYPSDLSSLTFPFYYNPVKNSVTELSPVNTTFSALLIPLGEESLTDEAVKSVTSFLSSHPFTLTALTGSLSNQIQIAAALKKDAVTTEGGTVILNGVVLEEMAEDYIVVALTPGRSLTIYPRDLHPVIPEDETLEDLLLMVDNLEKKNAEDLIESISSSRTERRILFLSSIAPSSLDWTDWTDYDYRRERSFLISDMLLSLSWNDAFASTRFSEETASGVTRAGTLYRERLDFIYTKGMITLSSIVVPIENLSSSATVADFLIP